MAQIADEADISIATLFKHVPDGKEALIFDDGAERRAGLVAAVRDRPDGQSVVEALRRFMASRGPFNADLAPELRAKRELIMSTPALAEYSRKLWGAGEGALAGAIAAETGRDPSEMAVRALARYVLEVPDLAAGEADALAALDAVFDLLESGWSAVGGQRGELGAVGDA